MSVEIRNLVLDAVRPLKRARGKKLVESPYKDVTHLITWGYKAGIGLDLSGDFVYLYEDQIDEVLEILKAQEEVDAVSVLRFTLEKFITDGKEVVVNG